MDAVARKIHVMFMAESSNDKLLNPNQSLANSDKL